MIQLVLNHYGDLIHKPYDEETAAITNLPAQRMGRQAKGNLTDAPPVE